MKVDKKSKLDKLKMPDKKAMLLDLSGPEDDKDEESPDDQDMPEEGSPEEEASESPEEESKEQAAALEQCSDEDLMAEVKKRGLMSKLAQSPDDEQDDHYSPADQDNMAMKP